MARKDPPIDWLKACILERMSAFGFTREDVCTLASISGNTFRTMMNAPATSWDYKNRKAVLNALHIRIADLPEDVQINIAQNLG